MTVSDTLKHTAHAAAILVLLLGTARLVAPVLGTHASVAPIDEQYLAAEPELPAFGPNDPADAYALWQRPDSPLHVVIQAGHWNTNDAPDELAALRGRPGAHYGSLREWQLNLDVSRRVAEMLEARGISAEVLPAVVPPGTYADAFVSVHADEHTRRTTRGYRVVGSALGLASPSSDSLAAAIDASYAQETGIPEGGHVTANMTHYYAFNWRKFEHSLHPMTPSAIIEMGYMTNANDRAVIVSHPDVAARAIANGIETFLHGAPTAPQADASNE